MPRARCVTIAFTARQPIPAAAARGPVGSQDGGDDSAGIAAGIDVMTSHQGPEPAVTLGDGWQVEPAAPAARAAARVIDSVVHAALGIGGLLLILLATFCIWCATHQTNSRQAALGALALIGWVLYEPVMVAWRGQTLGKAIFRIRIIRTSDGETPNLAQAAVRWAIPAAAGVTTTLVAAMVIAGVQADAARFLVMFAAWAPMYLTSFLDDDDQRRGWHDKVARTIVVRVADPVRPFRIPAHQHPTTRTRPPTQTPRSPTVSG